MYKWVRCLDVSYDSDLSYPISRTEKEENYEALVDFSWNVMVWLKIFLKFLKISSLRFNKCPDFNAHFQTLDSPSRLVLLSVIYSFLTVSKIYWKQS